MNLERTISENHRGEKLVAESPMPNAVVVAEGFLRDDRKIVAISGANGDGNTYLYEETRHGILFTWERLGYPKEGTFDNKHQVLQAVQSALNAGFVVHGRYNRYISDAFYRPVGTVIGVTGDRLIVEFELNSYGEDKPVIIRHSTEPQFFIAGIKEKVAGTRMGIEPTERA